MTPAVVTQRTCPRCHAPLLVEEESACTFCSHCGAPQVQLSQELRELAQTQIEGAAEHPEGAPAAAAAQPVDPTRVRWKPLMRMAAAVSACFAVFTFMLPPLGLLVPAVTLSLYAGRFRQARVTAGLGARLGLLCGLLLVAAASIVASVSLLVARLHGGHMAPFDAALAAQIHQMQEQIGARSPADAASAAAMMNIPEFRAGIFLAFFAMMGTLFLLASAISGAVAGFARSRTTPRLGP